MLINNRLSLIRNLLIPFIKYNVLILIDIEKREQNLDFMMRNINPAFFNPSLEILET